MCIYYWSGEQTLFSSHEYFFFKSDKNEIFGLMSFNKNSLYQIFGKKNGIKLCIKRRLHHLNKLGSDNLF